MNRRMNAHGSIRLKMEHSSAPESTSFTLHLNQSTWNSHIPRMAHRSRTCRQSHTFSRSYGANLPTSLAFIILRSKRFLNLGDLMRLWVRPCMKIKHTHSAVFKGQTLGSGHIRYGHSFRHLPPILELNSFLGFKVVRRKSSSLRTKPLPPHKPWAIPYKEKITLPRPAFDVPEFV